MLLQGPDWNEVAEQEKRITSARSSNVSDAASADAAASNYLWTPHAADCAMESDKRPQSTRSAGALLLLHMHHDICASGRYSWLPLLSAGALPIRILVTKYPGPILDLLGVVCIRSALHACPSYCHHAHSKPSSESPSRCTKAWQPMLCILLPPAQLHHVSRLNSSVAITS